MAISKVVMLQRPPGYGFTQGEAVDLSSTDYTPSGGVTGGIFVGGAGNIKVDFSGGSTGITLTGVLAGTFLPISASKIYKTGTTATNITALF